MYVEGKDDPIVVFHRRNPLKSASRSRLDVEPDAESTLDMMIGLWVSAELTLITHALLQ